MILQRLLRENTKSALNKLTIIGGVSLDVILPKVPSLPTWPDHSEFTKRNLVHLEHPPILTIGGNGGNSAFVAARCGAKVTLYTALGDDPQGELARGWLEKAGCRVVNTAHGSTPLNVTAASALQQRATFFYSGSPLHVPTRGLTKGGYLLVCGYPHPPLEEMVAGLQFAQSRGTFTSLDAGPIIGRPWSRATLRRLLDHLDLFIVNEHELLTIMQTEDRADAIRRLRKLFPGHVVIKRGGEGALWLPIGQNEATPISAPAVNVVNTVGAGDSFNGAMLAALAAKLSFPEAMAKACQTASRVVSSPKGVAGLKARKFSRS